MELKNKRVLVVGLGRSGVASAFFLQEHGAKVIVSDSKSEAQLQSEVPALLDRGISCPINTAVFEMMHTMNDQRLPPRREMLVELENSLRTKGVF